MKPSAGRIAIVLVVTVGVLGGLVAPLLPNPPRATAGHFATWVIPGAPFSGVWNRDNAANPATHSAPYGPGGDWAVDYYNGAGTAGGFYLASSAGLATHGVVRGNATSCLNMMLWAGRAYQIEVYDSAGSRGTYWATHVSDFGPSNPLGPPYIVGVGTTVGSGKLLGWTALWGGGQGVGSCYQVSNNNGVHWHLQMYQPTHYACYSGYPSSQALAALATLGAIGANATGPKQAC